MSMPEPLFHSPAAMIRQPTVHVPCTRSACVLPGCINLKLQTMNNKIRKTKKHGNEPTPSRIEQNTEKETTAGGQSAASLWDQDLTDILSILGDENNSISSTLSETDLLSTLHGGDGQLLPATSQSTGEQGISTLQDATIIHNTPSDQTKVQNQHVMQFQGTLSPGTKMESNGSLLKENDRLQIGQALSGQDTGTILNDVIANTNQTASQSSSSRNTKYNMNCAVHTPGASPRGVKRPIYNQSKQVEHCDKQIIGGNTQAKKNIRNPTQSTNNLFKILGLILQAFESPMTRELEEHYKCVLNRALFEIRNARRFLQ